MVAEGVGALGHPRRKVMFAAKARENGGNLLVYIEDERKSGIMENAKAASGSSSGRDDMHARWSFWEAIWLRDGGREISWGFRPRKFWP